MATESPIPEWTIEARHIDSLTPAPYNPRKIDDAAMSALTRSVERFGLVQPIIVNKRTGFVVGGHQRLKVLKAKGVFETPVIVVDLNETDEKALNVALNSPSLDGEFTSDLQGLIEQIETGDAQLFADLRLADLAAEEKVKKPPATIISYELIFDDAEQQVAWFGFLKTVKAAYPYEETIAARVTRFLADHAAQ